MDIFDEPEQHENAATAVIEGSVADLQRPPARIDDHRAGLTDQQLEFVRSFIENGGKAGPAVLAAGYAHETYGVRLLSRRRVQDEIARRLKLQSGSALAIAIFNLLAIIETSEDDRARVSAALGLMDRYGMSVPRGPTTAIQINNGMPSAQEASAVLQLVAERANRRRGRDED